MNEYTIDVEGGWASQASGGERHLRITVRDPANRGTMLELVIPGSAMLDVLSNTGRLIGQGPLGTLRLYDKGVEHYGYRHDVLALSVRLIGFGQAALDDVRDAIDQPLRDMGWTVSDYDWQWNGHRVAKNGTRQEYALMASRHVPQGVDIETNVAAVRDLPRVLHAAIQYTSTGEALRKAAAEHPAKPSKARKGRGAPAAPPDATKPQKGDTGTRRAPAKART